LKETEMCNFASEPMGISSISNNGVFGYG